MTQRVAIIRVSDGRVMNIAIFPDAFVPNGTTHVLATSDAVIGGTYSGGVFTPPVVEPEDATVQAIRDLADVVGSGGVLAIEAHLGPRP